MGPEFGLGLVKGLGFALIFFVLWLLYKGLSKGTKKINSMVNNALSKDNEKRDINK